MKDPHFSSLERMYLAAPINAFYGPRIDVGEAACEIEIAVGEKLFHAAGAVHGSVLFKMLDDAAFFSANSLEREFFVLTTSFTIYLMQPVASGSIRSIGRVVSRTRSQFIAEAVATDSVGNELARGSGMFIRSRIRLKDWLGYAD